MFKPGEMILYHMPGGKTARPFLVIQPWPNEYGPGKHGYNGLLLLDGSNDDYRASLNPPGRTAISRYDRLPFAYGYSVPAGEEEGMVSATPSHTEETAALPPAVNVSGWGALIAGNSRTHPGDLKAESVSVTTGGPADGDQEKWPTPVKAQTNNG